jgi:hypothetical protein
MTMAVTVHAATVARTIRVGLSLGMKGARCGRTFSTYPKSLQEACTSVLASIASWMALLACSSSGAREIDVIARYLEVDPP